MYATLLTSNLVSIMLAVWLTAELKGSGLSSLSPVAKWYLRSVRFSEREMFYFVCKTRQKYTILMV